METKSIIRIEIDQSIINKSKAAAVSLYKEIQELTKAQKENKKQSDSDRATFVENQGKLKALSQTYNQHIQVLKNAEIAAKANTGSNEQLKAQLSVLTSELNRLTESGKSQTDEAKRLRSQVEGLTSELIENESAVLNNRRKVGDYEGALKGLKQELKEAKDAMVATAAAYGMGSTEFQEAAKKAGELKDQLDDVTAATKEMASGSKLGQFKDTLSGVGSSLKNLDFDEAAEKAGRLAAIAKTMTFGEMIGGIKSLGTALLNLGRALLVNPFFAFAAAVTGIGLALKAWSDSNDEALEAQKKLNDEFEKSKFGLRRLDIEYRKITGTITGFQASVEKLNVGYEEAMKGIADDTEKSLKESIGWWDKFLILTTQGRFGMGDILTAVQAQNQSEKLETIKHTKELQNLYAQQAADLIKQAEEFKKEEAETRAETAEMIKKEQDKKLEEAKEQAEKLKEVEAERLAALRANFEAYEQENFDKRQQFFKEQLEANQTEIQNEKDKLKERVQALRFAGVEEIEIEKYIASENKRIRIEGKERELTEAEALINKEAAIQKNIITATIDDEKKRTAAIRELEKLRLESIKNLYDEQYQTATASLEGIATVDKETSDLMRQRSAEVSAELVELKRNEAKEIIDINKKKTDELGEQEKTAKDAAIQSAQTTVGAISEITGSNREEALDDILSKLDQQREAELSNVNLTETQKAAINKKYDKLQSEEKRRAFEKEKQAKIIEAIINTALAVIKALPNYINAALAGVAGAAQIAVISSQPTPNFKRGGIVKAEQGAKFGVFGGKPHSQGGNKFVAEDGTVIETEKDELWAIVNKRSTNMLRNLSMLNEAGGGVPFGAGGIVDKFAGGGITGVANNLFMNSENNAALSDGIAKIVPVLVLEELEVKQGIKVKTQQNLEL